MIQLSMYGGWYLVPEEALKLQLSKCNSKWSIMGWIVSHNRKSEARRLCSTQWPQILCILLICLWLPFGWKSIAAIPGVLTWHEPMSKNGTGLFLPSMSHFRAKKPFLKTSRRLSLTPYWSEIGHMPTSKFSPGKRNETSMIDLSQLGWSLRYTWGLAIRKGFNPIR